jgi:hypothetical protein
LQSNEKLDYLYQKLKGVGEIKSCTLILDSENKQFLEYFFYCMNYFPNVRFIGECNAEKNDVLIIHSTYHISNSLVPIIKWMFDSWQNWSKMKINILPWLYNIHVYLNIYCTKNRNKSKLHLLI